MKVPSEQSLPQQFVKNALLLKGSLVRRLSLPHHSSSSELKKRLTQLTSLTIQQSTINIKPAQRPKLPASINKIGVKHNVKYSDSLGIQIHISFYVTNLREYKGTLVAYFYFTNGMPLKDFNGSYQTKENTVCVARSFKQRLPDMLYKDFVLFMPYRELHLGPGNHSLKFTVSVWNNHGKELTRADGPPFTYTSVHKNEDILHNE